jgi:phosphate starvation-inducible PhoH-like protein
MSSKKKSRATNLDDLSIEPRTRTSSLDLHFEPKNEAQKLAMELWSSCRILFLLGEAGTGKSAVSFALALQEAVKVKSKNTKGKVMLCRPMVTVGEPLGFLPGDVNEKVMPWLLPFHDVLSQMTFTKFDELGKYVDIEPVPLGLLRGRTIRDGTLICSEMQNATYAQIKCALTRLGPNSRIIIEGDTDQSDCFDREESPLQEIANRLSKLDSVGVVNFLVEDQLRCPLISDILDLI